MPPTFPAPVPKTPLTGSNVSDRSAFSWYPVPGALKYKLQVSTESDNFSVNLVDLTFTDLSHYVTGLRTGINYVWRVQATPDNVIWSDWSTVQTITVVSFSGGPEAVSKDKSITGYRLKFYIKDDGQSNTSLGLSDPSHLWKFKEGSGALVADRGSVNTNVCDLNLPLGSLWSSPRGVNFRGLPATSKGPILTTNREAFTLRARGSFGAVSGVTAGQYLLKPSADYNNSGNWYPTPLYQKLDAEGIRSPILTSLSQTTIVPIETISNTGSWEVERLATSLNTFNSDIYAYVDGADHNSDGESAVLFMFEPFYPDFYSDPANSVGLDGAPRRCKFSVRLVMADPVQAGSTAVTITVSDDSVVLGQIIIDSATTRGGVYFTEFDYYTVVDFRTLKAYVVVDGVMATNSRMRIYDMWIDIPGDGNNVTRIYPTTNLADFNYLDKWKGQRHSADPYRAVNDWNLSNPNGSFILCKPVGGTVELKFGPVSDTIDKDHNALLKFSARAVRFQSMPLKLYLYEGATQIGASSNLYISGNEFRDYVVPIDISAVSNFSNLRVRLEGISTGSPQVEIGHIRLVLTKEGVVQIASCAVNLPALPSGIDVSGFAELSFSITRLGDGERLQLVTEIINTASGQPLVTNTLLVNNSYYNPNIRYYIDQSLIDGYAIGVKFTATGLDDDVGISIRNVRLLVRATSTPALIAGQFNPGSTSFALYINGNRGMTLVVGGSSFNSNNSVVPTNVLTDLAVTYQRNGNVVFYVNGVDRGSTSAGSGYVNADLNSQFRVMSELVGTLNWLSLKLGEAYSSTQIMTMFKLGYDIPRTGRWVDLSDSLDLKGRNLLIDLSNIQRTIERNEGQFFHKASSVKVKNE